MKQIIIIIIKNIAFLIGSIFRKKNKNIENGDWYYYMVNYYFICIIKAIIYWICLIQTTSCNDIRILKNTFFSKIKKLTYF